MGKDQGLFPSGFVFLMLKLSEQKFSQNWRNTLFLRLTTDSWPSGGRLNTNLGVSVCPDTSSEGPLILFPGDTEGETKQVYLPLR